MTFQIIMIFMSLDLSTFSIITTQSWQGNSLQLFQTTWYITGTHWTIPILNNQKSNKSILLWDTVIMKIETVLKCKASYLKNIQSWGRKLMILSWKTDITMLSLFPRNLMNGHEILLKNGETSFKWHKIL